MVFFNNPGRIFSVVGLACIIIGIAWFFLIGVTVVAWKIFPVFFLISFIFGVIATVKQDKVFGIIVIFVSAIMAVLGLMLIQTINLNIQPLLVII